MKRLLTLVYAICVVATAHSAGAQQLAVGVEAGRAYSITDAGYVPSISPGITLTFGPVLVSSQSYFRGSRFFEQWTQVYLAKPLTKKLTLSGYVSQSQWPAGAYRLTAGGSFAGQVGFRWRLR